MPSGRLNVVVTRRLPEPVETRMRELFDVTLRENDGPMTREELARAVREADVLVPTLTDRIDAGLIAQAGGSAQAYRELRRGGRSHRRGHRPAARHPGVEHAGCADR